MLFVMFFVDDCEDGDCVGVSFGLNFGPTYGFKSIGVVIEMGKYVPYPFGRFNMSY